MTRPLMQLGMDSLVRYFSECQNDDQRLLVLMDELSNRQTQRARDLLKRATSAHAALGERVSPPPVADHEPTRTSSSKQLDLVPLDSGTVNIPVFLEKLPPVITLPNPEPSPKPRQATSRFVLPSREPTLTLSQAVAALKLKDNVSWAVVEEARRKIVAQSCPTLLPNTSPSVAQSRLEDAARANDAYEVLRRSRHFFPSGSATLK
ncbi:hypothetical protein QN397_24905 [Variovorax sp. RTB1]|uniref:hypothetical protein n=1 Tax=Variovorax sp. RTB1 TaxID=3048631 RepID=UPI002B22A4B6|nr:hypothetical protein [Variovorax sp. RTB1]MEB0114524.1 hypothetical protein [Variovorax sp. RTB1]